MARLRKLFGIAVAVLFFVLGSWILFSPRFENLARETRVIFAVFLFLYGAFRIVRYIFKDRDQDEG